MIGNFAAFTADTQVLYAPVPLFPGAEQGWNDYQVGSDGSFWSRPRGRGGEWTRLKPHIRENGYVQVYIHGKRRHLHKIAAQAFLGPCPDGLEVLHYNDDKSDNRLSNLRYGTPRENAADAKRNGRKLGRPRGKGLGLSAEKAIEIVRRRRAGEMVKKLAEAFRVTPGCVHSVLAGSTWSRATGIGRDRVVGPGPGLVAA